MLAADHLDRAGRGDELARLTVDATDIDRASLDRGRRPRRIGWKASARCRTSWRARTSSRPDTSAGSSSAYAVGCRSGPLDLSRELPLRTNYDLILCRNVVIYFDRAMQERLFQTFADALVPGGYLVLGKVETLFGAARDRLALVDPRERVYRRPQ